MGVTLQTPYTKSDGYPIKTHKRDVYWRVGQLLNWHRDEWWERVSQHPSVELRLLEELVVEAERGTPEALSILRGAFLRPCQRSE